MSSARRNNQSPKLYLHQPSFTEPSSQMQTVYQSNKRKKRKKINKEMKEAEEKKVVNEDTVNKKKFKDMSIEEKVEHFAAMPKHLPRVRCEIITDRKKYYGFIHDYQNEMVSIKTPSRVEEVAVPIQQIKAINIAGF
ncbi:CotO family spore coat protein [Gracilibacillus xinjiangensis]|uniref:CotO family spore coat protein n=1 Tax=Gracilibacillus xinjiangensis TaxID=1193282 RepID=A0ABV8WUZ6_9BACI